MRFEETERYAEIIHKYECKFGRTPKSLVYTEYSKSTLLAPNVFYRVNLHEEAYILRSLCSSQSSYINPCMGSDAGGSSGRSLAFEGFAGYFTVLGTSNLKVEIFVSYYKPIW